MPLFALFRDSSFIELRNFSEQPENLPHKNVVWVPVGEAVEGEDEGWAIVDNKAVQTYRPVPAPSISPIDYPLEPFQFFAMLGIMGASMNPPVDLKTSIINAIDAIPEVNAREVARAKYEHTQVFRRDNPLFAQIAPLIGLTESEIDIAWMQAKDIV